MAVWRPIAHICPSRLTPLTILPSSASFRSLSSSSPATPYPLYYEAIEFHPSLPRPATRSREFENRNPETNPQKNLNSASSFQDWLDQKISDKGSDVQNMDRSKQKYYRKRYSRMYGSDGDDDTKVEADKTIELKPEIVDLPTYHAREEELYFHDMFAFPREKDKHYRMVYKLEKKYFPDQCFDKAFVDITEGARVTKKEKKEGRVLDGEDRAGKLVRDEDDKHLLFFDDDAKGESGLGNIRGTDDVTGKRIEDFFKCLRKVPSVGENESFDPFLVSRKTGLPPRWDKPHGSVILVNKPKGWTSFTVCGKLRRLVKVQKVGHAGTLDPMATGLLIVCVGKAAKHVDRYQSLVKSYSGVFRLGEATSTWDADSPVIQREPWEHIKDEEIRKNAASFVGEIWQVPPMFSDIKAKFSLQSYMFQGYVHTFSLCRYGKGSWQLCSFGSP